MSPQSLVITPIVTSLFTCCGREDAVIAIGENGVLPSARRPHFSREQWKRDEGGRCRHRLS